MWKSITLNLKMSNWNLKHISMKSWKPKNWSLKTENTFLKKHNPRTTRGPSVRPGFGHYAPGTVCTTRGLFSGFLKFDVLFSGFRFLIFCFTWFTFLILSCLLFYSSTCFYVDLGRTWTNHCPLLRGHSLQPANYRSSFLSHRAPPTHFMQASAVGLDQSITFFYERLHRLVIASHCLSSPPHRRPPMNTLRTNPYD